MKDYRRSRVRLSGLAGVLAVGALVPASGGAAFRAGSESCTIASAVRAWPLDRLARQVIVVPIAETQVAAVRREVGQGIGGVLLFGSAAPADLGSQLAGLLARAPGGVPPAVMTDEEGGKVQRMAALVGPMPSARRMARTMSPAQVRDLARRVGRRMRAVHVAVDLAPVLDLDGGSGPNASNPDGTRSFGTAPVTARTYGLAFAAGMRDAGVLPVVKHFPGLGQASANPDYAPTWTQPWPVLQRRGLRPFRAAIRAGLPAVMVTTARVPGLTTLPAALSRHAVHDVLRISLGFGGLAMTDSLTGGAVSGAGYSLERAAVRALRVGIDMVLYDVPLVRLHAVTASLTRAIVGAVQTGTLPLRRLRSAVVRVLRAKGAHPSCPA